MLHKNFPRTSFVRARVVLFSLVAVTVLAGLPSAAARLGWQQQQQPASAPEGVQSVQTEFIRLIPVAANDVVYNPADQTLYASVPASAGAAGNSIIPINPATGATGAPVFIGSDPSKMAMSDDGHTLYAFLEGAYSVRRFDTQTRTAGQQFSIGQDSFFGLYRANDLAVAPGNPNVVAVVRYFLGTSPPEAGVAIFDNGVQRPKTGVGHIAGSDFIAFSASESKLYGGGDFDGLRTMTIDATGVAATTTVSQSVGSRIKFDGGLIYGSAGKVMNPDTGALLGTFANASSAFVPDSNAGRVYYFSRDFSSGALALKAFDINTFVPVGSATLAGVTGEPKTLVRWGSNGLAFTTTNNQLYVVQTSLIPSSDAIPTPTPTPIATATPTPTPFATLVRKVDLPANDLVISPSDQKLYVSVPSTAGARGNTITAIDPAAGALGASTFVGSEPNRLAISDDGQVIYAALDGAGAVRRYDVATQAAAQQFTLGNSQFNGSMFAEDIAVAPGQPSVVAVSLRNNCCSPRHEGVAVFDNGVMRPQTTPRHTGSNVIEFSSSPTTLYGHNNETTEFGFRRMTVNASGVSVTSTVAGLIGGFNTNMKFAGGRIYTTSGRVVDPEAGTVLGTFNGGGAVAVDQSLHRAFFLSGGSSFGSTPTLTAFDTDTFLLLGSVQLGGVTGVTGSLVRWGANGLAFNTIKQSFDSTSTSQVYLIQSALVSDAVPIPSALQFSAANYNAVESGGPATVTVARTGDTTGAVTINYATEGGTATPGSDYTAVSGTLTFAAGETTKTFAVPILDDNIFEGSETVGLTLSAPGGTALLGTQPTATLTIQDNESRPSVSPVSLAVLEGASGTTNVDLSVRLTNATTQTVTVNYRTSDGTATAGSDYVPAVGTLTFAPGETAKTIPLQIVGDAVDEGNENFFVDFSDAVNANAFQRATITIIADEKITVQFPLPSLTVGEAATRAAINVTRAGDLTSTVTVRVRTVDNPAAVRCDDTNALPFVAFARCDYATAVETLTFAPGETTKTFFVSIINDAHPEPDETVTVALSNPTGGALIGTQSTMSLRIVSDDATVPPASSNPALNSAFFVRMQYLDFFGREPDADGFAAWKATLDGCPDPFNSSPTSPSANCDRVAVSTKFFRSREFEQKGGYVFNFYRVALNRLPHYSEIIPDMASLTAVDDAGFFARKAQFTDSFVQRQEFKLLYDALSNQQFVDALMGRYNLQQITTPNPATPDDTSQAAKVTLTRADLVARLNASTLTRAQALRALSDSDEVRAAEANSSFVAMQYFGYLRRDPEEGGYNDWLRTINANPADIRSMVNGFMNSTEYRLRFGTP
ncbi:MAG TPA: Calx-beta domain-containing protein [Pyrinomonadaceae bacterium]|jgi:hypothetical protein